MALKETCRNWGEEELWSISMGSGLNFGCVQGSVLMVIGRVCAMLEIEPGINLVDWLRAKQAPKLLYLSGSVEKFKWLNK